MPPSTPPPEGGAATRPASGPAHQPRLAVYAGVFDPPTLAHLGIIETALRLFDRVTVVVARNPSKGHPIFTPDERVDLILASLPESARPFVEVVSHAGLIAPFAESLGACALVRGMRPYLDPDGEVALALMNQKLAPRMPTVLLVASAELVWLSSTFVRDAAQGGTIVAGSVSPPVEQALRARFHGRLAQAPRNP